MPRVDPLVSMGAGAVEEQAQLQNQYAIEFLGLPGQGDSDLISIAVDTAALPTITVGEVELQHLNERRWNAGGITYETMSVVCKDLVTVPVAAACYRWFNLIYDPVSGHMGLPANYKKQGGILLFGPDGGYQRQWTYHGCWIQTMNFGGTLDQASKEGIVQIEMTIRYDRAEPFFTTTNSGPNLNARTHPDNVAGRQYAG